MASLLPNNYITVNVDSEVGYSYSYSASADLSTLIPLNEADLPHSSDTLVDTHFTAPEAGPSTTADLQLQETQRRRREEEAQFASLRAQYGMDEQGNYVQQSDAGLRQAVTRSRLSVMDYYERSQAVAQAERRGAARTRAAA